MINESTFFFTVIKTSACDLLLGRVGLTNGHHYHFDIRIDKYYLLRHVDLVSIWLQTCCPGINPGCWPWANPLNFYLLLNLWFFHFLLFNVFFRITSRSQSDQTIFISQRIIFPLFTIKTGLFIVETLFHMLQRYQ